MANQQKRTPAAKKPKKATVAALVATGRIASKTGSRRAEDLLDLIARRITRIREDFYDIGVALRELMTRKLFLPLGYASFDEMLAKRGIMGRTQAYKLIAIARQVPRKEALAVGQERAYALIALASATPEIDDARTILAGGVKVRGKAKDVSRLSKRELEDVTKAVRKPKKPTSAAKAAAQLARRSQQALRARGLAATVLADRQGDRWWATVRVPIDELDDLLRGG